MKSDHTSVLIVGAGLCGLSAGFHLQEKGFYDYLIVEQNHEVGGLARTETFNGFSFDHSIHILYTSNAYAAALICEKLLAGNLRKQTRQSFCYSSGVYTEYPYQINNYGLPSNIIVENLLGLIETKYNPRTLESPTNFESWIYKTFGRGIAEHFMIPYNRRVWAWDLRDMSHSWIAERVPMPDIKEVLLGAIKPPENKYGPNREFWYPLSGGIQALAQAFFTFIPNEHLLLSTLVTSIDAHKHTATLSNGREIRYDYLLSSLPLPTLIKLLGGEIPNDVQRAAHGLRNNIVHTVNIGLEGTELGIQRPIHWIYFPEDTTIFHRISFPHNFSEWMVPRGCSSIQAEISESIYRPRDRTTLITDTLLGLVSMGILTKKDIRWISEGGRLRFATVKTLDPAYIIYDLNHQANTGLLKHYLKKFDIETRGRFGEWEYFNMDHTILSGKFGLDEFSENARRHVA